MYYLNPHCRSIDTDEYASVCNCVKTWYRGIYIYLYKVNFFFIIKWILVIKPPSYSFLFYLCCSFGHVNWPQLSDWCVILDRQLSSALYSVFKHSGDSSVSCQHVGLWEGIVQMLLSQTRRFHCQRELAALIKHHYMCHYACARALWKVFGPLQPRSCT